MTLHEIYQAKLPEYQKAISSYLAIHQNKTIANPLLISDLSVEKFVAGELRIMFFGQETNGWYNDNELKTKLLQKAYDDFYTSDYCYSYGGQFWNGVNRFKSLIENEFSQKKITFIWNNIIKAGKQAKGRPDNEILEFERKHFNIIQDEIAITNPNIIVFFTGPNYDDVLKKVFPDIKSTKINNFTERQLAKINISNHCIAYRTYHPNYLWRNNINRYFNTIISDIKKCLTTASTLYDETSGNM